MASRVADHRQLRVASGSNRFGRTRPIATCRTGRQSGWRIKIRNKKPLMVQGVGSMHRRRAVDPQPFGRICYRLAPNSMVKMMQAIYVLARSQDFISPTAGGGAQFLLSFSMPTAWRAVAGAVARPTTPVRTIGDSRHRRPVATLMLKWVAVLSGTWPKIFSACKGSIARAFCGDFGERVTIFAQNYGDGNC